MNILSFDIEEWFIEKTYGSDRKEKYREYNEYLDRILSILDETHQKATFFCVGQMGVEFPGVVKKIVSQGHEIGCHSNTHRWLNKMSREKTLEDTRSAVDLLEQCVGTKIKSYRAPAFSIGESNKWAFEILASCGIERDASVYPATRDFGGFPNFGGDKPAIISCNGVSIKEYPIPMAQVLGRKLAYSGGGYFRFFPLWFVKSQMKGNDYNMCYFHIDDLIPEQGGVMTKEDYEEYFKEPGTWKNRHMRYFKANVGKAGAFKKMETLVRSLEFVSLEQADGMIDWTVVPKVQL